MLSLTDIIVLFPTGKMAEVNHDSPFRTRVNASLLQQFHGKPICFLGFVLKVSRLKKSTHNVDDNDNDDISRLY